MLDDDDDDDDAFENSNFKAIFLAPLAKQEKLLHINAISSAASKKSETNVEEGLSDIHTTMPPSLPSPLHLIKHHGTHTTTNRRYLLLITTTTHSGRRG